MSLLRIPKGLLKLLIFLVALIIGIAFAAVRTQGGRDMVAAQIEAAFSNAFAGSLEIGRLYGDVFNTLYAVDVILRDPDGRAVVRVDSIVARISVIDALQRNVTIRTAEFVRPNLTIVRSDTGSWNIAGVFDSRQPGTESTSGSRWRFRSADVRVRDGRINMVNEGDLPAIVASGRLFDYTNAEYGRIHGRLTVDLGNGQRLVDVINLGGRIAKPDIELLDFHGQLVATDSTLTMAAVRLATKQSEIDFSGSLVGFDGLESLSERLAFDTNVRATLNASRLDSSEIAGLFPRAAIPTSSLRAEIGGSRADMRLAELEARVGNNFVTGSGSIRDSSDFTDFSLNLTRLSVTPGELTRLVTGSEIEFASRIPEQHLTAEASGRFNLEASGAVSSLESILTFQTESRLGVVDGTVEFADAASDTASYSVDLNFLDLAVGELVSDLGREALWNGHLEAAGRGIRLDELAATADLSLTQSSLRGLTFDSIVASAVAEGRTLEVDIYARRPTGGLDVATSLDFSSSEYRLDLEASLDRFGLVEAVAGSPTAGRSAVTSEIDILARGSSLNDLSGFAAVAIDTVTIYSNTDTVGLPASFHRLNLTHQTPRQTSLKLTGDVFEGELQGIFTFGPLARTASLWLGAANRTLENQLAKLLHPEAPRPEILEATQLHLVERRTTEAYLREHGFEQGLHFSGALRVNRLLDLHRLFGFLPRYASNVSIRTGGQIGPDELNLQFWVDGDSLRGDRLEVDGVHGQLIVAGSYDSMLDELVTSDLNLRASRAVFGTNRLSDLVLDFGYADRTGSLEIESAHGEDDSLSVLLDADLRVLSDRNEIVVSAASLNQVDYTWELLDDAVFDLFGDAVRVDRLTLVNREKAGFAESPQRLTIEGTLSRSFGDTLFADANDVSLDQISELLNFRDHLGGQLDASVKMAHLLRRPEVVGDIRVEQLSYIYRDVGDLTLSSTYSGEGESIFIDATLTQPREPSPSVRANEARIAGTIAVPDPDSDVLPGALDIQLTAERVDLFFFEVLFPSELDDVSGTAAGSGRVMGVLTRPIFDAEFQILESSFRSPPFNLRFALSGPVTVDSLGFHIQDAALTDPTGGHGTFRGDILFNDYRFFSFNLSGEFEDLMIMNVSRSEDLPFYGELWVSASATLTGPLQRTQFRSTDVVTSPRSRLYMPVTDDEYLSDQTFIVFTDSTGAYEVDERQTMLDARPPTERGFIEGMNMNFNITISPETTVFLVFDALLGDMIQARGSGRVQFLRFEGEYSAFGTFVVSSGDYLFTAGDVFQRRFILDPGGTITWDGDAVDAALDIPATYRTRASLAGLPGQSPEDRVPIRVNMSVSGRLTTPQVALRIALDIDTREGVVIPPGLESALNREDLAAEYATSVLLTNTFLLTSSSEADPTSSADDLFFNSLSHLVSSQVNRFVSQALDLDVNVGVQQGRTDNAYDLVYGFALRLDEQGIVIRGEGLYETAPSASSTEGLQGQFVVEYRLTPKVKLELFFRRESDLYRAASTLGTSYGAGIVYQTDFANWKSLGGSPTPTPPEEPSGPSEEGERREEGNPETDTR